MSATDAITIEGLRIDRVVGVYPHERDRPRPLELDVRLSIDSRRAGASERLALPVDCTATREAQRSSAPMSGAEPRV